MTGKKLNRYGLCVLLSIASIGASQQAHAQFYNVSSPNLQIITNSVANQAFVQSVTSPADVASNRDDAVSRPNPAALRFVPNLAKRKANLAGFVAKTRALSPETADQMAAMFASQDIIEAFGEAMTPHGLRTDNVADAYTIYWISAWKALRGDMANPTPAQVAGVKSQSSNALLAVPEFLVASASMKQELTESLLVQTALIESMTAASLKDPTLEAPLASSVRAGAQAMGIDLDAMRLSKAGFVAK